MKNTVLFIGVLVVGALLGSFMGDVIARFLPEGPDRALFLKEITAGLSPTTLDLKVAVFTLGFVLKVNITSVVGIMVSAILFRNTFK